MKRRTSLALNMFPPFVLVRFFRREMWGALHTERLKASRQRDERRLAPSNIPPSRKWVVMNPYFSIISWAVGAEHPFPSAGRVSGRAGCAYGDVVTVPARLSGSSYPASLVPPSRFPSCLPALGGRLWVATSKWCKIWGVTFPWRMELLIFFLKYFFFF